MKTLNFLLFISLLWVVVFLNNQRTEAREIIANQEQTILKKDSLIQVIQKSNSKYLPIAVKCNKEH